MSGRRWRRGRGRRVTTRSVSIGPQTLEGRLRLHVFSARTEVGLWADHRTRVTPDTELLLRGRAAWAHDDDGAGRVTSTFMALPGATFTVDGASSSPDLALLSAVAELRMRNGLSLSARFDGEFGERSESYAAAGTFRYRW